MNIDLINKYVNKFIFRKGDTVIDLKTGLTHTVSHVHIKGSILTIITVDEIKLDSRYLEKK